MAPIQQAIRSSVQADTFAARDHQVLLRRGDPVGRADPDGGPHRPLWR